MTVNECRWQKEFRIPSITTAGREVLEEILFQLRQFHWSHKDVFAIHLALEEALVNAIRHGNRSHQEKHVMVYTEITANRFFTRITDEGAGFNPSALPDPTSEDFLERPCGRGVKLMQNYMSDVIFNEVGNEVILIKNRTKIYTN